MQVVGRAGGSRREPAPQQQNGELQLHAEVEALRQALAQAQNVPVDQVRPFRNVMSGERDDEFAPTWIVAC